MSVLCSSSKKIESTERQGLTLSFRFTKVSLRESGLQSSFLGVIGSYSEATRHNLTEKSSKYSVLGLNGSSYPRA